MKTIQVMMFAILLMVMGCKSNEKGKLTANEWQLKEMVVNGTTVALPKNAPEIIFTDSTSVFGSAGCNRFFGTYEADEKGKLTIKPGGSTMMFCPDMQFEDQYLKVLGTVATYGIKEGALQIKNADNTLILMYVPKDTTQVVGVANDSHGCNAAAGFTWSEVQQKCIRLFEDGVRVNSVTDTTATSSAFIVFAPDSLKVELFLPNEEVHPILDRRALPAGGFAWNVEDDDTKNVRILDGNWIIEQRGNLLYSQTQK